MYLKNIEVHGFKSFAQKINFEFHNGITGIVGPNGSGKSNVADAVRWVLGEQSAKQLRGGNMQDVIFSGTENRKPLSYASVAITLDNSDHILPVSYEEVTVTRRLYRSGESEYLINKSPCRLKDLKELFYDTGIGKEGYSIIGQGQIDRILSGKPEERRELFDEAAGIVKFKRRKATALKKLEEEKLNLVRVTDILTELTRQLGPLERQSEQAKIYLKKKEELKTLDVNMFLLNMSYLQEQIGEVSGKYELAGKNLEEKNQEFEKTRLEYEKVASQLEVLEQRLEEVRELSREHGLLRQNLEGQINVLKEQINTGKANDEHYQTRLQTLQAEDRKRQEELEAYEEQKAELHKGLKEKEQEKSKKEEELAYISSQIQEIAEAVEEGKNEIIEILNSRSNTKGKIQRFDAMMEQVEIRKSELSQRTLALRSEEEEHALAMAEAKDKFFQIRQKIEELVQENKRAEEEIAKLQELIKKENQQMDVGQTAYHREASRLESLRNITERYDGYGNSIRRVMEKKKTTPGIKGVVADLIHVEKDYEVAIETALGAGIQNIVTDNEQTAKSMIQYLKQNRFGRATFLPLTNIGSRGAFQQQEALKEPGVLGLASDLVQVDPEYLELSKYLLGRTLVVDHIDHAIPIGKKYKHTIRMVTIEGESLNPGGSMTGGAYKNSSNLLGRRREIEELEESVNALKADMDAMQQKIEEDRKKRNQLRDQVTGIHEKLQEQYILQNTAKMQLNQLEEKKSEVQSSYEKIQSEKKDIAQQLREVEENRAAIARELESSQKEEKELEDFIQSRQQELEELNEQEQTLTREVGEIQLKYSGFRQKESFLLENMQRVKTEIAQIHEEKETIESNLTSGNQDILEKETKIEELRRKMDEISSTMEKEAQDIVQYQEEREVLNGNQKSFFEKRDQLSGEISLLDKESFRLSNQMEKLENEQESHVNYMWEEYEITPIAAEEMKTETPMDRGEIKKEISQIKAEIKKLGSVNVNAIEDYKELSERHVFLSSQHEDLVKAEQSLLQIIDELDAGMRKQFSEKFKDIQREFDKAFKELFGGGKGTLELMEDEDLLEAGIKIISQPPGKKLQNMMQLSGGEKALTAIALLFAIQNLKPSPFCLLDEIEAALDDSNVVRFAQYVHKLTKNTQFIIITHRRGTMNAADRLYGITMQEKGVSTLVSVDLVENDLIK